MATQDDIPESFTEAEVYQALSWGMPDAEARRLAKIMSGDGSETLGLQTDLRDGEHAAYGHSYSEDSLLLFSLVSDETNRKVEQWLAQMHLGEELTPNERAKWERRRAEFRKALIKAGKIRE